MESVENSKNKTEFSTLSTGLGNPAKNKNAGFPHFHRADGEVHIQKKGTKNEGKTKFQLTDSVTSSTITAPASLRSDRDRNGFGMSDRDQIGITDHLHRNQQHEVAKLARHAQTCISCSSLSVHCGNDHDALNIQLKPLFDYEILVKHTEDDPVTASFKSEGLRQWLRYELNLPLG